MVITDFLYDFSVGIACALVGALISTMFSRRKTRRLTSEIVLRRRDLDALRLENNRLLETIKNRETQILELQKKILDAHSPTKAKRRGK
ncbi:MAG TPA: hypothetical protein DD611_02965 [Alphaproteobacteria bacterium]|nr:hypothetical protein [Alphaproteobacteria bacterium]HBS76494.1 hypothetical protein [Alphaproteobacteria bacterium]